MHLRGGYPAEIAEFNETELSMCLNNVVWDIQRGNILKLVEGKQISRGYHGRKLMNDAEIEN